MSLTQSNRIATIATPLGTDAVIVEQLTLSEQLGRMFQIDLDLLSTDANIKFDDIVGHNVTLSLKLQNDGERFFNGFVSRFVQTSSPDRHAHYRATVVPWLWLLTRTADCRIFQNKTIPAIIEEVFSGKGFTDFRLALSGNYPAWEFCVQYRETDFNFVSRLMEQEGMFYFFAHENGKHTLVITDSNQTLKPYPDYASIPYRPDTHDLREREIVFGWTIEMEVQPGAYALNDFDFTKPSTPLLVRSNIVRNHGNAEFEVFDYPGEYEETAEGQDYSQVRLDELQAQREIVRGQSNARGIAAGSVFKLADYPRLDQNRDYVITSVIYHVTAGEFESGGEGGSSDCSCSFAAIPLVNPFRSQRITPKPLIQGPQTAIVSGPAGEEIHTDDQARVRLQFHWDRYGQNDENSSCFIRVSQANAGKGWGSMITPRIGQEVIVEFLEGDPDRPIITGRVYNGENAPPFASGGGVTSGIKSQTHKGSGSNEIGLDDTAGKENFKMNAQFDMNSAVGNNQNNTVAVDQSNKVGSNQKEDVGSNREISIGSNDKSSIGANREMSVGSTHKMSVGSSDTVSIGGKSDLSVGGKRNEVIGGMHSIMNPMMMMSSAGSCTVAAGSKLVETSPKVNVLAGSQYLANSGGKMDVKAAAKLTQQSGAAMNIKSGAKLNQQSAAAMNMKSGAAMKAQAGGAMNMKASGSITQKGSDIKLASKTKIKGTTLTVS